MPVSYSSSVIPSRALLTAMLMASVIFFWFSIDFAVKETPFLEPETVLRIMKQYPDRFYSFATLPWNNPTAAADELRRCVNELGFVGTLISGRPQTGNVFL